MKSTPVFLALLVSILFLPYPASAQDAKTAAQPALKLAIISSRDILTRCDKGVVTISEIQKKFSGQRAKLSVLEQDILKLQEAVNGSPVKGPKSALLQEKLQAYAVEERKLVQEVTQEEGVQFKPILEVVNKVLDDYAKEKSISAIQERGAFVYYQRSLDVTEEIIKRVNLAK